MIKNKNVKNFIIYSGMSILQKMVAFLFIPLLTIYLSPEEFGLVSQVNAIGAAYILLFLFALDEAAARFYFEQKNNKDMIYKVLGSILAVSVFINIIGGALLLVFSDVFYVFFINNISSDFIVLSVLLIVSSPMYSIYIKLLRIQGKANKFIIVSFLNMLFQIICILIFVVYFNFSAIGYMLSLSLTTFFLGMYSLYNIVKSNKLSFDKQIAIQALQYAVKIVPHTLTSWGLSSFTIIIIGMYLSAKAVGIYSVIYYLGMIITVLANSLLYTYQPWLYKILEGHKNIENLFLSTIKLFNIFFIIISFFLALFSAEIIILLFNERYHSSTIIAPLVIYSSVILFMGSLHTYVLYYYKEVTGNIAKATVGGASINIILSLFLIPIFDLMGAALSFFISQLFIALLKQYYSFKRLGINKYMYEFYFLSVVNILISMQVLDISLEWSYKCVVFVVEVLFLYFIYKNILIDIVKKIGVFKREKIVPKANTIKE